MDKLTEAESALARLMLDKDGKERFVVVATDILIRKQRELGIARLGDLGSEKLSHLFADAIVEAASGVSADLDIERLSRFVDLARLAWRMDASATVAVDRSIYTPTH